MLWSGVLTPRELHPELRAIARKLVEPGKGILAADESPDTFGKRVSGYETLQGSRCRSPQKGGGNVSDYTCGCGPRRLCGGPVPQPSQPANAPSALLALKVADSISPTLLNTSPRLLPLLPSAYRSFDCLLTLPHKAPH